MTHVIPGRQPVTEALRAGRPLREVVLARGASKLGAIAEAARSAGVPVREAPRNELDDLAGGVVHQGAAAVAAAFDYADVGDLLDADLLVLLDGVTDPQNLGSVARSAEAAGAGGLLLPRRRSAHPTPAVEKAAAGALSWLPLAIVPNAATALATLSDHGFWSVGLDGDAPTALWDCDLLDSRLALVVGAEGAGLSRLVRERVDALVSIPLRGRVGSLNVANAATVALFEAVRRRSGRQAPSTD